MQISASKTLRAENERLQERCSSQELSSSLEVSKLETEKVNLQKDVSNADTFILELQSKATKLKTLTEQQLADAHKKISALESHREMLLEQMVATANQTKAAFARADTDTDGLKDANAALKQEPQAFSGRPQPTASNNTMQSISSATYAVKPLADNAAPRGGEDQAAAAALSSPGCQPRSAAEPPEADARREEASIAAPPSEAGASSALTQGEAP